MDFDDLDRGLLHALQLDGRAPFRRIGEVLGVSDQTVARRYARLRAGDAVRVVGFSDPVAVGDVTWLLRIRCGPDAAPEIADALARRPDTSWISLTSGGTEITCSVRSSDEPSDDLLLHKLPRTPGVLDVSAHQVLHVFYGGAREPFTKHGALDATQVARLTEHVPDPGAAPEDRAGTERLDETDRRLLRVLRVDGRTPVEELARATGASATTVRRRLHDLRASGLLVLDVDADPGVLALPVRTALWLTVAPAQLETVGRALAGHAEVPFTAATTGRTNIYTAVAHPDVPALYRYLTTRIAELPGVQAVETAPTMRTVKAADTHYTARRAR